MSEDMKEGMNESMNESMEEDMKEDMNKNLNKKIRSLIESIFGLDAGSISDDTEIKEIPGWDSMMFVMILSELQEKLGISIPIDKAIEIEKISDFYGLV